MTMTRPILLCFLASVYMIAAGAEGVPESSPTFNRDVLPILADHCFKCHGADAAARKAGLRLDVESAAKHPLRSGQAAVQPGAKDQSALYQRITATDDGRMPPPATGDALSPREIETLARWIDAGAVWEDHWAYIPPVLPGLPAVSTASWPRNGIDSFVLARLDREGIVPSPEAGRRTLIRRLCLDLTGLPPTPDQVTRFVEDASPDAYEQVVDELLASPHFGEKWARWWLDLAAYADSDGYLSDFLRPWAWRYRQWVVDALNADMPFDDFTIAQLAGDLLPNASDADRIATGFLRNTTSNREGGADLEEFRTYQAAERTRSIGTVWLASTIECAQCHDHKFDPITQREFFQLYAFFNDADEVNIAAPINDEQLRFEAAWPVYRAARDIVLAPVAEELATLQRSWEEKLIWAADNPGAGDYHWDRAWEVLGLVWGQNQGEGQLEGTYIVRKPEEERTEDERIRLQDYFLQNGSLVDEAKFTELGISAINEKLDALRKTLPQVSRAPTIRQARLPRQAHIHVRGDFRSPGDPVEKGTPAILNPFGPAETPSRLDLARWLVDPANPLTSRVVVNRLWQELYGYGIVRTSDDFGVRGGRPSHPDLLDWLAVTFVNDGWRIKPMIKRMVMSTTYRQTSDARPELNEIDPGNVLIARYPRTRISAELVRDNALAVSGLLNDAIGGPSVRPAQPASVTKEGFANTWEVSEGADRYRRGLYTFIQRTSPFGQSVNFDFPDPNRACTRRVRSNTPLQALNLLNDETFFEAAKALAARVHSECDGSDDVRIDYAFQLCLARPSAAAERERLARLLEAERQRFESDPDAAADLVEGHNDTLNGPSGAAWVIAGSVILNLDEFITKE